MLDQHWRTAFAATRAEEVSRRIRSLQGAVHEKSENLPYSATGSIQGQEVAIVAFEILLGPAAIPSPEPFVQFYRFSGEQWYLAAESPRDLSGLAIRVQQLESPVNGEIWVLATGKRYGDNRARLSARLLAFDGGSVRTVWQRDELPGGVLHLSGRRMSLQYFDLARWAIDPPNREDYEITGLGPRRIH